MFSTTALMIAAGGMVPLSLLISYIDVKHLRIPNWTVLAVFGVFLAAALPLLPWGLDWETFLWRLGYGVIAFFAGFGIYSVMGGKIGAGDLKLLAVLVPFLSAVNFVGFAIIYIGISIVGLILYLAARMITKGRKTGFKGLDTRGYFPAGILLGISMAVLLCLNLSDRLAAG